MAMNQLTDEMYEKIAAYALGSLDQQDMVTVEQLLASSPAAREELRELRDVVGYLPYAAPAVEPPDRVRRQLFARIAASQEPVSTGAVAAKPVASKQRVGRLLPTLMSLLATFVLLLGGFTLSLQGNLNSLARTNRELSENVRDLQASLIEARATQQELLTQLASDRANAAALNAQLADDRKTLAEVNAQLATLSEQLVQEEYVLTFVTAPGVATRELAAAGSSVGVQGEMYMYPGQRQAVVLFRGLPALQSGQVYQFWLADGQNQVPGGIVEVGNGGVARLIVEAPREVNAFSQVMVTIERAGGSTVPSEDVVLEGSL
jgi:anti-sigma factor RsiW